MPTLQRSSEEIPISGDREPATVLGINRTQDASLCVLQGGEVTLALQKERLTRRKHHWGGLGDLSQIYAHLEALRQPIDLVVECYSCDPQFGRVSEYHQELRDALTFRGAPRIELIPHHRAHLYSVFPTSPFSSAAVMIIDSMGSPLEHLRAETADLKNASALGVAGVEVASFYHAHADKIVCIGKQVWDLNRNRPVGLGNFYHYLTQAIFPGHGNDGKVMGLAAYGDSAVLALPELIVHDCNVYIPEEWLRTFKATKRFVDFPEGSEEFAACANLAAAGQAAFEEAILKLASWLSRETNEANLCFAGGTALNCVANGRLSTESYFENVFVPPAPHDGGTALGCAVYGMREILGIKSTEFKWTSDYLGKQPSPEHIKRLATAEAGLVCTQPPLLAKEVASLLAKGCIIVLFQGRSEFGPRALGHRSIVADPRRVTMRDWINRSIKGREAFRPLAPVVLLEDLSTYFVTDRESPFMSYSFKVIPEMREVIPAVVHCDGSARLQSVNGEVDDAFLFAVLKAFKEQTGVGVLLNTSFNGKNDPIVDTETDAIAALRRFPLHGLVTSPYLILKEHGPPIPA